MNSCPALDFIKTSDNMYFSYAVVIL